MGRFLFFSRWGVTNRDELGTSSTSSGNLLPDRPIDYLKATREGTATPSTIPRENAVMPYRDALLQSAVSDVTIHTYHTLRYITYP